MIAFMKRIFGTKKQTSLSAFIKDAPTKERDAILEEIVRRSSADQREVVRKFHELEKTSTSI